MKHRIAAFLHMFLVWMVFSTVSHAQGLRFTGLEKAIEKRTSYDVFGGRSRTFHDFLSLDFQIYMYPEEAARFGYFFRIREKGGEAGVWNLFYGVTPGGSVTVRFNQEGRESLIKAVLERSDLPELHWVNVSLKLDFLSKKVILNIAGKHYEGPFSCPEGSMQADIIFGASDYVIDVPSFAMRSLSVADRRGARLFPFTEESGNRVHDSEGRSVGKVQNPGWMIGESSHWKKVATLSLPLCAGFGFDEASHRFHYFDRDNLIYYNLLTGKEERYGFANPCPMYITPASNFIRDGRLVSYEPCGHLKSHRPAIASLDLESLEWSVVSGDGVGMQLFHHTGFMNPVDSSYCIFGGFGDMMYNGRFYSLAPGASHWERKWQDCSVICPRYFVSSGVDSLYAYFFGGMGNASGEQVVGRKYFYDFYRMNLADGNLSRLWSLPSPKNNYVPVRNMVIDGEYAYTLCYPEYLSDSQLTLHRFGIADGSDTVLEDAVEICSDKLFTNAALYLDRDLGKLFAVTQVFTDDVNSTCSIYSLNWPVMFENITYEDISNRKRARVYVLLSILLAVILAVCVVMIIRRSRRLETDYRRIVDMRNRRRADMEVSVPDSIHIFGQFQLVDHNGRDISGQITGQQREILLLIIKYSLRGGISSERLSKIMWPDKEDDKVKNSRGVAINKLRSSLSSLQGVSVVYEEGSYRLEVSQTAHCDFFDFERLVSDENSDIQELLAIVCRGKFISFSDSPIFDSWKARVEDKLSVRLHKVLPDAEQERDCLTVLEVSDVLFGIDPLDEVVLRHVIHALKLMHQNEDARVRYADFISEWRQATGEDYHIPYGRL